MPSWPALRKADAHLWEGPGPAEGEGAEGSQVGCVGKSGLALKLLLGRRSCRWGKGRREGVFRAHLCVWGVKTGRGVLFLHLQEYTSYNLARSL